MTEEIITLLKKAVDGDLTSFDVIIKKFQDQQLSVTEQEEIHLYLKQISQNNFHAIYLRGLLYDAGYGVTQDFTAAFLLFREAAAKGHALAIYEVGHHFLLGHGVEKDNASAEQWLSLAAGSPHYIPAAMYDLGMMYEGSDVNKAKDWYTQAAQKGHPLAKEKLTGKDEESA